MSFNGYKKVLETEETERRKAEVQDLFIDRDSCRSWEQERKAKIDEEIFGPGSIGENVTIARRFVCEFGRGNIKVGDGTYINFNTKMLDWDLICIGEKCNIGSNVVITAVSHPTDPIERREADYVRTAPVKIGNVVWIGSNSTIDYGVIIGDGSIVAANSFVPAGTVIPPGEIWGGVPARKIKDTEEKRG